MDLNFEKSPKTFFVEEIFPKIGVVELGKKFEFSGEGDYTWFVLEKENWNTIDVAKSICRIFGVSKKRVNYSGMKDRQARTTQLMSLWKVEPEKILNLKLPEVWVNGAWKSDKEIKMGDAVGNRFRITVKKNQKDVRDEVYEIYEKNGGVMPNYFGEQRFGILNNTHLVGEKIIKNDFEGAVQEYLCGGEISLEKREDARNARSYLRENLGEFKSALDKYPKYLKYERTLLSHLCTYPNDFIGALRKLPRKLSLLFIHSYQSSTFNKNLEERYKQSGRSILPGDKLFGLNEYGFPTTEVEAKDRVKDVSINSKVYPIGTIAGYETGDESFKIKSFPEISSKGAQRFLFVPINNFKFEENESGGVFSFELQSGSYATVALALFTKE